MIGGGGFLGRHIVESLLAKGYDVNVFDLRQTFHDERATFFVGDLCEVEVIHSIIKHIIVTIY